MVDLEVDGHHQDISCPRHSTKGIGFTLPRNKLLKKVSWYFCYLNFMDLMCHDLKILSAFFFYWCFSKILQHFTFFRREPSNKEYTPTNSRSQMKKYPIHTTLSAYFWKLKDKNITPSITWKVTKSAPAYNKISRRCLLCFHEKVAIITRP